MPAVVDRHPGLHFPGLAAVIGHARRADHHAVGYVGQQFQVPDRHVVRQAEGHIIADARGPRVAPPLRRIVLRGKRRRIPAPHTHHQPVGSVEIERPRHIELGMRIGAMGVITDLHAVQDHQRVVFGPDAQQGVRVVAVVVTIVRVREIEIRGIPHIVVTHIVFQPRGVEINTRSRLGLRHHARHGNGRRIGVGLRFRDGRLPTSVERKRPARLRLHGAERKNKEEGE